MLKHAKLILLFFLSSSLSAQQAAALTVQKECGLARSLNGKNLFCQFNGVTSNGVVYANPSCETDVTQAVATLTAFNEVIPLVSISRHESTYLLVTDLADLPIRCQTK